MTHNVLIRTLSCLEYSFCFCSILMAMILEIVHVLRNLFLILKRSVFSNFLIEYIFCNI